MASHSRALVTGASAGIGRSYAEHLARTCCALVLVARRRDRLEDLAVELRAAYGVEVAVRPANLGDPAGVAGVADRLGAELAVDLLVNNAGYASRGAVVELDPAALAEMIQVNVVASARLSHAAMKAMTAAGRGRIINVSSGSVFVNFAGNAGYGAAKSVVAAFTRTMQVESEGRASRCGFSSRRGRDGLPRGRRQRPGTVSARARHASRRPRRRLAAGARDGRARLHSPHPDVSTWAGYVPAEAACRADARRDKPAARYHGA